MIAHKMLLAINTPVGIKTTLVMFNYDNKTDTVYILEESLPKDIVILRGVQS